MRLRPEIYKLKKEFGNWDIKTRDGSIIMKQTTSLLEDRSHHVSIDIVSQILKGYKLLVMKDYVDGCNTLTTVLFWDRKK